MCGTLDESGVLRYTWCILNEEELPMNIQYANVVLSCKLWTYLADLNDEQYPCQGRGNRPGGADLCMNLEEYYFLNIT